MGFSISGLLSDVGIKLPNIDLSNLGSTVLDAGKQLLGDVVKDSFTLSNQPGQTFASNMDIGGINLPNPLGSLANSLLGDANSELSKLGVNVDFKSMLGNLFNLPTQAGSTTGTTAATSTTVPSLQDRLATNSVTASVPGAAASVANAQITASDDTSGSTAAGAAAVGGGSTVAASTDSSSGFDLSAGLNSAVSTETSAQNLMQTAAGESGPQQQADMMKAQQQMEQANEMFTMLSQILQDQHQTKMAIINNMKT